jgi:transposase
VVSALCVAGGIITTRAIPFVIYCGWHAASLWSRSVRRARSSAFLVAGSFAATEQARWRACGVLNSSGGLGLTRFDGHPRSVGFAALGRMFIMDGMGKQRRPRRLFTPEFKAEIVEVCRRGDRTIGQVAKDFDLTETAVREWVRQADIDAGVRSDGLTTAEREELAALRRENRRLAEDVEILKRATAFFAKEIR